MPFLMISRYSYQCIFHVIVLILMTVWFYDKCTTSYSYTGKQVTKWTRTKDWQADLHADKITRIEICIAILWRRFVPWVTGDSLASKTISNNFLMKRNRKQKRTVWIHSRWKMKQPNKIERTPIMSIKR